MIILVVLLVGGAVLLWPRGRVLLRPQARTGLWRGPSSESGVVSDLAVLAWMRGALRRELRFGRSVRGWVSDFAELPSAEAARLA